jgi:DHA1 family bicyclomycin/chloramphenicol resistance-like MFS transporter
VNAAEPLRAAAPPLLLLVLLAGQQPLALNFIAPATPGLARSLATDYGTIQFTLTLYLVAVAVSQLVSGPLSDRYGRRPAVIASMALYVFGCALAWIAESAAMLIAARILQGAGAGSVFALVRAVIRDTAGREETASRIGYVTTVMVVVPMVSPMLGGLVDQQAGGRCSAS